MWGLWDPRPPFSQMRTEPLDGRWGCRSQMQSRVRPISLLPLAGSQVRTPRVAPADSPGCSGLGGETACVLVPRREKDGLQKEPNDFGTEEDEAPTPGSELGRPLGGPGRVQMSPVGGRARKHLFKVTLGETASSGCP